MLPRNCLYIARAPETPDIEPIITVHLGNTDVGAA